MNRWLLDFMRKVKIYFLILIFLIIFSIFIWQKDFSQKSMLIGVTFSKPYSEQLGLNWPEVYLAVLDDLGVKALRLIAYWPDLEKEEGIYDFTSLDWQIAELEKRGGQAILVIGRRLPRWPECHEPPWTKNLPEKEIQKRALRLLPEIVTHYQDSQVIKAWQIENEPLLTLFGQCPKPDKNFLAQEVKLVKSLDSRPVIITDSGELSLWLRTSQYADILGTTLYRVVWNKYLGYFQHFYPPAFYAWRGRLVQKLYKVDKVIITELQAEPWVPRQKFITEISLPEQFEAMDLAKLKDNLDFSHRTGFSEAYLWGVEWWYWLKIQGHDSFWREAKKFWW